MAKDAFTQQDIAFHRETAAAYDDEITAEYGIYHEYSLAPFVEKLARERPNGRVLDLGCGTGAVTLRLAERGLRVNGVDHSPEMLELARAKAAERGLAGRIELETGDVRELRFGDAEFDGVTCQGLLHHLEDIDPCLGELTRVLNPGGRFYISEPTTAVAPPKRVLMALWRGAKRVRRGRGVAPAAVDTVEQPIQPGRLLSALDRLGLEYEVEYLSHLPRLHGRIPDRARLALERAISRPWKRRQGDLIFVQGSKAARPRTPVGANPPARGCYPHREDTWLPHTRRSPTLRGCTYPARPTQDLTRSSCVTFEAVPQHRRPDGALERRPLEDRRLRLARVRHRRVLHRQGSRHDVPRGRRDQRRRGTQGRQDHRRRVRRAGRRAGRDRPDPVQDPDGDRSGLQGRDRGRRQDARRVPQGHEARHAPRGRSRRPDLGRRPLGHGPVQPEGHVRGGLALHRRRSTPPSTRSRRGTPASPSSTSAASPRRRRPRRRSRACSARSR